MLNNKRPAMLMSDCGLKNTGIILDIEYAVRWPLGLWYKDYWQGYCTEADYVVNADVNQTLAMN